MCYSLQVRQHTPSLSSRYVTLVFFVHGCLLYIIILTLFVGVGKCFNRACDICEENAFLLPELDELASMLPPTIAPEPPTSSPTELPDSGTVDTFKSTGSNFAFLLSCWPPIALLFLG